MKRLARIAETNLSLPAKWLAACLRDHAIRGAECTMSRGEIEVWTGFSSDTITRGINALESRGLIRVVHPFKPGPNSKATFALTWIDNRPRAAISTERHQPQSGYLVSANAESPTLPRDDSAPPPKNPHPSTREGGSLSLFSSSSSVLEGERVTKESVSDKQPELSTTIEPEWREVLSELSMINVLPGQINVRATDAALIAWAKSKGYTAANGLRVALLLKGKWPDRTKKNLRATFQDYLNRGIGCNGKSESGVSANTAGERGDFADPDIYRRAREAQRAVRSVP